MTTELPYFKKRSLDRLAAKSEDARIYPVSAADLIRLPKGVCPVCESKDISLLAELFSDQLMCFSTSVCRDCLYVFRPVSPRHSWFRKCWEMIAEDEPEIFNPEMEGFRAIRYGEYVRLVSQYTNGRRMLDIGAGYGTGTRVFRKNGFDVTALEPELNRKIYLRRNAHIHCHDASVEDFVVDHGFADWDVAIFSQCLEHLDDPVFAMYNAARILAPGGILYVEIPLVWDIADWSDALFLAHKSNFTRENFSYLAESAGFDILESVEFRNGPAEPLDFGLVLSARQSGERRSVAPKSSPSDLDRMRRLYRKGLPKHCAPSLRDVVRYQVPQIEQFYYSVRLDKIKFKAEDGYVRLDK